MPASAGSAADPAGCGLKPGGRHAVTRVVDGDTLVLDDRSEVRLIGALAPYPPAGVDAAAWPPAMAAKAALERLVLGRSVALKTAGRRLDRHGRRLAHVFVEGGADGASWVQQAMLAEGHARAYGFADGRACLATLLAAEAPARAAARGLWANAAYAVRRAADKADLLRLAGSYEIVEGTIASVTERGRRLYLNFGRRWSEDFTATVAGKDRSRFVRSKLDPAKLAGRKVRVRGWIEDWRGPHMAISFPEQIEVLDGATGTSAPVRPDPPIPVGCGVTGCP
jgi:endonuclease YncB( thermonuclease family)